MAKEIIEKHYENKVDFQTVSIRSTADYEDQKQSISIGADIRIKKDEITRFDTEMEYFEERIESHK